MILPTQDPGYPYVCEKIISLPREISLLRLLPSTARNLSFLPGQYVETTVECLNHACLPLSIASLPSDPAIEIHLRHDDAHPLAQAFLDQITRSPALILSGPKGRCTWDRVPPSTRSVLLLAGGTGFAPLRSLLSQAFLNPSLSSQQTLHLYWGIRHPLDAYDKILLDFWQAQHPNFNYTLVLSAPHSHPEWTGAAGWVHAYMASQYISLTKDTIVFASGPYAMIQAAKTALIAKGLASERLLSDMLEPS